MESDKIKIIVGLVNEITASGDKTFAEYSTLSLATSLATNLVANASKSPTFAVAVVQKLDDEGFHLNMLEGEAFETFRLRFSKSLGQLDEPKLLMVRKISEKLFN